MSKRNRHNNTKHEIRRSLIFVGKSFSNFAWAIFLSAFSSSKSPQAHERKKEQFCERRFCQRVGKIEVSQVQGVKRKILIGIL